MFDSKRVFEILDRNGIPIEEVCLVGGAVLAEKGIRKNDDIDIIIKKSYRDKLSNGNKKAFILEEDIEVVGEYWGRRIGISDDLILNNSKYHYRSDELKFVDLDILILNKRLMRRKKDIEDVKALVEYRLHEERVSSSIFDLIKNKSVWKKPWVLAFYFVLFRKMIIAKIKQVLEEKRLIFFSFHNKYPLFDLSCDIRVLLSNQYVDGEFNRFDIWVRYDAAEKYLNNKNDAFVLYSKMQMARSRGLNSSAIFKYQKLIESVEENGFVKGSFVYTDKNNAICDGAHRVALAALFGKSSIAISLKRSFFNKVTTDYSLAWFNNNGFNKIELNSLKDLHGKIILNTKQYFIGIVWPTAIHRIDKICEYVNEKAKLINYEIIDIKEKDFEKTVFELYKCDDIEDWKIDAKLKSMMGSNFSIGVLRIEIGDPCFRRKSVNNSLISSKVEAIKKKIRNEICGEVENYMYDNILHIGDNFQHTDEMEDVIQSIEID